MEKSADFISRIGRNFTRHLSPRNGVWLHGDLHPDNLLVKNGKISAVIDFGSLGVGDPACDMMIAWTFLTNQTRKTFRKIVDVDDATWERGRGWALSFALIALVYYKDSDHILANIGSRTITEAFKNQ